MKLKRYLYAGPINMFLIYYTDIWIYIIPWHRGLTCYQIVLIINKNRLSLIQKTIFADDLDMQMARVSAETI